MSMIGEWPVLGALPVGGFMVVTQPTVGDATKSTFAKMAPGALTGLVPEAPNDGSAYGRQSLGWSKVLPLTGGALTGTLTAPTFAATGAMTLNGVSVATVTQLPIASSTTPLMDGTAATGTGTTYARTDHVHPTDTSRYAVTNPSGYQTAAQVTAMLPPASNASPVMNGTAAPGAGTSWSRFDHVHPTDTSRAAASALASYLPLAGGTLTGPLTATFLTSNGGISAFGDVNYGFGKSGSDKAISWFPEHQDWCMNSPYGERRWTANYGSTYLMTLSNTGSLTVNQNSIAQNFVLNQTANGKLFLESTQQRNIRWNSTSGMVYSLDSAGATPLLTVSEAGSVIAAGPSLTLANGTWGFTTSGNLRRINWTNQWFDTFDTTNGNRVWTDYQANPLMTLKGDFTGLIVNVGNIQTSGTGDISSGHNLSATNAVIADHILAFRTGYGFGGTTGSWDTTSGLAFGFRVDNTGTGQFGPVTASTGNLTAVSHYLYANGQMTIAANGYKPGGGPWADSSDARAKDVLGDYEHGLAEVLALKPIRYRFREDFGGMGPAQPATQPGETMNGTHTLAAEAGTEFIGLIAQDVEGVMPEMVSQTVGVVQGEQVDDLRVLDMSALPLALVNAVRDLDARLRALETAAP